MTSKTCSKNQSSKGLTEPKDMNIVRQEFLKDRKTYQKEHQDDIEKKCYMVQFFVKTKKSEKTACEGKAFKQYQLLIST